MRRYPVITGLLAFAAWFAAEAMVYNLVAGWIGGGPAFLLFIAKPVLGFMFMASMLRRKLVNMRGVQGVVLNGSGATDASLKIIGAILIVIPGFLAGLVGLALLTRSFRRQIVGRTAESRRGPRELDLDSSDWREEPDVPKPRLRRRKAPES
jgi:UPF0716 family protein affecting phage T7 exclusion